MLIFTLLSEHCWHVCRTTESFVYVRVKVLYKTRLSINCRPSLKNVRYAWLQRRFWWLKRASISFSVSGNFLKIHPCFVVLLLWPLNKNVTFGFCVMLQSVSLTPSEWVKKDSWFTAKLRYFSDPPNCICTKNLRMFLCLLSTWSSCMPNNYWYTQYKCAQHTRTLESYFRIVPIDTKIKVSPKMSKRNLFIIQKIVIRKFDNSIN